VAPKTALAIRSVAPPTDCPRLPGALQAAGLFATLTGALKFLVHNPICTYALMGLASLAFAAIILALNPWTNVAVLDCGWPAASSPSPRSASPG
jgi:hypothetical protein